MYFAFRGKIFWQIQPQTAERLSQASASSHRRRSLDCYLDPGCCDDDDGLVSHVKARKSKQPFHFRRHGSSGEKYDAHPPHSWVFVFHPNFPPGYLSYGLPKVHGFRENGF